MRKVDLRFFFISEKNIMQINFSSQNSEEFTYTNFFLHKWKREQAI